jgi:hypothetical protein
MPNRRDLDRLTAAQRRLVSLAQADLRTLFATLDPTRPDQFRDALLDVVPRLVEQYGDLAAVAAAEWYEQVSPTAMLARTADGFPTQGVEQGIRYHAGALFDGDAAAALSGLSGALQRYVTYSGRATVARNVQLDRSRPRFARVPQGAQTCAWCTLLASRGFVYLTRETAGITASDYHDECDCQITPMWDRDNAHIEGYDPDGMYDLYLQARDAAPGTSDKAIAAQMREMFPDQFTDGHVH